MTRLRLLCVAALLAVAPTFVNAAQVDTASAALATRVAPGDLLPVSVKLLNFGGGNKVDAAIAYVVKDAVGSVVVSEHETVAVETTASFVKSILIPSSATPGWYTAAVSITYQGQLVPADTEFSFTVERKYFGLFQNEFAYYSAITAALGVLMGMLGRSFAKQYRRSRLHPVDYADIPHADRVFYELVSDTVLDMRRRVGDVALDVARTVPGLKIDGETGRVLSLSDRPSKVIASLVAGYEDILGKQVSFTLRPTPPRAVKHSPRPRV